MGLKKIFNRWMKDYFIFSLIIAALVIISAMIITHVVTYKPQRYSAIGLLNENHEAGPFPSNMSYNETLTVYFQVGNHEGESQRYKVNMYIGDQNTTIDPDTGVNAPVNKTFQRIVEHGEIWEENVVVTFDITNIGMKKIIFELWIYDLSLSTPHFIFMQQTVHIWIEIST
ncbi:MAG: DUF1616 domain-containing protein [Candidatus Hodarchaeota archaeon]